MNRKQENQGAWVRAFRMGRWRRQGIETLTPDPSPGGRGELGSPVHGQVCVGTNSALNEVLRRLKRRAFFCVG